MHVSTCGNSHGKLAMGLYNCIIIVIPTEAAISVYLNNYTAIEYIVTGKIRVLLLLLFHPWSNPTILIRLKSALYWIPINSHFSDQFYDSIVFRKKYTYPMYAVHNCLRFSDHFLVVIINHISFCHFTCMFLFSKTKLEVNLRRNSKKKSNVFFFINYYYFLFRGLWA